MRIGCIGEYVIISRAFEQGPLWGGAYKVRRIDSPSQAITDFVEETVCDGTFETREAAEDFAFEQAHGWTASL